MAERNTTALETDDALAASVQVTPHRVTLESMEAKVSGVEYINPETISHMTLAIVMLENGFCLLGRSTPADPANFDAELGRKFARDDAIRQMWQLEGYVLREKLSQTLTPQPQQPQEILQ